MKKMKWLKANSSGQMFVLLMVSLPALLLALALVVDTGIVIHRQIRLQTATDLATYAGASVLSDRMTKISRLLSKLRNEWEDAIADRMDMGAWRLIAEGSADSHEWLTLRYRGEILDLNEDAFPNAVKTAKRIMQANIPWADPKDVDCQPYYPTLDRRKRLLPLRSLDDIVNEPATYHWLTYPDGGPRNPLDPENINSKTITLTRPIDVVCRNLLDNSCNKRIAFVCRGVAPLGYRSLTEGIRRLFFGGGGQPPPFAAAFAAAQPYGGTLRNLEVDRDIDIGRVAGDRRRQYRPSLIPLRAIFNNPRYHRLRSVEGNGNLFRPGQIVPPY